jgi:hypothetical protein
MEIPAWPFERTLRDVPFVERVRVLALTDTFSVIGNVT